MITRFSTTIPIDNQNIVFDFLPVNTLRLQLFQVYTDYQGKRCRFHVQINSSGEFEIADPNNCPEPYRDLGKVFSDAVFNYCRAAG